MIIPACSGFPSAPSRAAIAAGGANCAAPPLPWRAMVRSSSLRLFTGLYASRPLLFRHAPRLHAFLALRHQPTSLSCDIRPRSSLPGIPRVTLAVVLNVLL